MARSGEDAAGVRGAAIALIPMLVALGVAALLVLLVGENPIEAFQLILKGSLGSSAKLSDTIMVWVPLTLAAAGLVVTFAAGLWNIGVEGQIALGAIGAALIAREVAAPPIVLVPLTLIFGVLFGIIWALFAGALKTYGKVNEIFGGLGLDFVATGLTIYLIIGTLLEEVRLKREFGEEYAAYQKKVSMLIPWKWVVRRLLGKD